MQKLERALFVGTYFPGSSSDNPAFSHAANSFQEKLIAALQSQGMTHVAALSIYPASRFPQGPVWYSGHTQQDSSAGLWVRCVPYLNLLGVKPFAQFLSMLFGVLSWARKLAWRPQAVVVYNPVQRWTIPALIAARLYEAPSVCIAADVQSIERSQGLVHFLMHKARAYWLRKFAGVVVLSGLVAEEFLSPNQSWMHLEGGVSPNDFQLSSDARPLTHLYYAGTLSVGSGVKLLLEAFDLLPEEYQLMITGNGPLVDLVSSAAASSSRLSYLGVVSREEQLSLLHQAGILINPRLTSLPENRYNFPSKLLDYLASGRPVISTLTADLAAEYADLVHVCEQENPRALASTITKVASLDPKEVERRRIRAHQKVVTQKSWALQGKRLYEFICSEAIHSR